MHNTKVKLPKAPIVRPIIEINKFNVGHDLANLNTRSYELRIKLQNPADIEKKKLEEKRKKEEKARKYLNLRK